MTDFDRQKRGIVVQVIGEGQPNMEDPMVHHWWRMIPDITYWISMEDQEKTKTHQFVIAAREYDETQELWDSITQDPEPYFATVIALETLGTKAYWGIKE